MSCRVPLFPRRVVKGGRSYAERPGEGRPGGVRRRPGRTADSSSPSRRGGADRARPARERGRPGLREASPCGRFPRPPPWPDGVRARCPGRCVPAGLWPDAGWRCPARARPIAAPRMKVIIRPEGRAAGRTGPGGPYRPPATSGDHGDDPRAHSAGAATPVAHLLRRLTPNSRKLYGLTFVSEDRHVY